MDGREHKTTRKWLWLGIAGFVVVLVGLAGLVYYLMLPTTPTARIRDVFLVLLTFVACLVGVGLVVLIVEMGLLLYTLYVEVLPILESLQRTTRTVQGTTVFLGEKVTQPVIRVYGWMAALRRVKRWFGKRGRRG